MAPSFQKLQFRPFFFAPYTASSLTRTAGSSPSMQPAPTLAVTVQGVTAELDVHRRDGLANSLGGELALLDGRVRENHGELLAAIATRQVSGADDPAQRAPDRAQDPVAGRVAVDVVKLLEVVDVEHDQRLNG